MKYEYGVRTVQGWCVECKLAWVSCQHQPGTQPVATQASTDDRQRVDGYMC